MRRILSTFLLLLLTLPLVAPALGQTTQQKLLLCCRKSGAHHCITSATTEEGLPAPSFRAHCPVISNAAVTGHATNAFVGGGFHTLESSAIGPLRSRQVEAGYRIAYYRSQQQRGPPTFVLS